MPKYVVSSGDFCITIKRKNPKRAAMDAIALLKKTDESIVLGVITGVASADGEGSAVYLSTVGLMEENGIKYRIANENA